MACDPSQNIKTFLESLKLADKYCDLFTSHGYMTVGDCMGISEDTLKHIGVTPPGHYRRILNKLPGCAVTKPPRTKQEQLLSSNTTEEISEPNQLLPPPPPGIVDEGVYDIPSNVLGIKIVNNEHEVGAAYSEHTKSVPPIKPPRSPDKIRKSPFPGTQETPDFEFQPSFPHTNTIRDAVDILLHGSPRNSETTSPKIQNQENAIERDPFETYNSLGETSNVSSLSLPSPPSWTVAEGDTFEPLPSPPVFSGEIHRGTNSERADPYDKLNLNLGLHPNVDSSSSLEGRPYSSDEAEDVYDTVKSPVSVESKKSQTQLNSTAQSRDSTVPNLQIPPPRKVPNYEEVSLVADDVCENTNPHATYKEPQFKNDSPKTLPNNDFKKEAHAANSLGTAANLSNVGISDNIKLKSNKIPLCATSSSGSKDSSVKRSQSFELYETASESDPHTNSSNENVYDICSTIKDTPPLQRQNRSGSRNSHTLPRSSGSLPSNSIKPNIAQSPTMTSRRSRTSGMQSFDANFSDLSSDADVYLTAEDVRTEDNIVEDSVYQTIDHQTEASSVKREPKPKKHHLGSKAWAGKAKLRLGPSRKARPLSAFVDNIRHGLQNAHSSSEESLESFGKEVSGHKRAVSTSDSTRFSTGSSELVDAKLLHAHRNSTTTEPMISPQSPLMQKVNKKGWLYKHGGNEGRAPLRKRWVVFDGEDLIYYENDTKMELSKGIIPVDVILRVQVDKTEPRVFHIVTKGGRKYIFNAENSDEKALWTSTLLAAMMIKEKQSQGHFKPGGTMYMPYREGLLKLEGNRQKIYFATKGDMLAYYKSSHEFNFGQPIARLSMKIATVKELDKKRFQIVFPFRTFTLTAESEEEKRSWVEALNEAIAEGLSDYKVVQQIWSTAHNRKCADCGREDPDWASINLAIVICKHCAGVHRDLGVHNSKVRSLKMDIRIWNETMKNMILLLGNNVANSFWRANINSSETITDMADKKQRAWHITSKYIEMRYLELHRFSGDQELLNLELIEAVRRNDLTEAYKLVFSGADPNCATGKEHAKTPHLLAKYLGYDVMAEFLAQNGATEDVSPQGHVTDRSNCVRKKDSLPKSHSKPSLSIKDQLYKYGGDFKSQVDDKKGINLAKIKRPGEFQKRLCVLENNVFKYYDPDRVNSAKDEIECSELLSVAICLPELATRAGYSYCFEVSRATGRTYLFCSDRKEILYKWTQGLMQSIVPPHVQNSMKHDMRFERIGKLWMKSQHLAKKSSDWRQTWCSLEGKHLYYFHQDSMTMEVIDLRRLVQIGLDLTQEGTTNNSTSQAHKEPVPTFMLVFREKSFYFRSDTKPDSESWLSAIKKADSDSAANIEDQQQTAEGVPIILEKCTTFVEQFGLTTRGIYRLSGTHSKTTQLLSDFKHNARDTQMHDSDVNVHDVANALKRWFKSLPGSLLTEELHDQWIETAQIKSEHHRQKMEWYKHLIETLPVINRNTLKNLLIHLNNVANHEKENEMSIHNLAIVFGPTLLESQSEGDTNKYLGQTSQEIGCVEDLLRYYAYLFDPSGGQASKEGEVFSQVTDIDREKERRILEAKEKIMQASQQQSMLTTLDYDMMVPIYLNHKDEKCANYKVNMTAGELVSKICKAHNYPKKTWGLFEVIADGSAERPLHHSEHVLSVIKAWEMPSTNYLLAKHDYARDQVRWVNPKPKLSKIETLYEGEVRVFDPKKKWVKVLASLKRSDSGLNIHFAKSQEGTSVRDVASGNWRRKSLKVQSISRRIGSNFDVKNATTISLSHYNIYLGLDKAKTAKPPSSCTHGFILAHRGETTRYFLVDSETTLYKWYGNVVMHKFPDGFSPPPSPDIVPSIEQPPPRATTDTGPAKRFTMPPISQGDLGEAAKKIALQRLSSNGSDDLARENVYDTAEPFGGLQDSSISSSQAAPPTGRPVSLFPFPGDNRSRFITSPLEQRAGGIMNMRLQNELSCVLRKRTEQ